MRTDATQYFGEAAKNPKTVIPAKSVILAKTVIPAKSVIPAKAGIYNQPVLLDSRSLLNVSQIQ